MTQPRHPAGSPASLGGKFAPGPIAPEYPGELTIINRDVGGCDLGNGETAPQLIVGDEDPYCARCEEDFPELSALNATGPAAKTDRFDDRVRALLAGNPGKEVITPDEVSIGDSVFTDHRGRGLLSLLGVVARVDAINGRTGRYEVIFHDGRSLAYTANSPVFIDRHVGYQYKRDDRWEDRARALTSNTTPTEVLEEALNRETHTDTMKVIAAHPNATGDQIHRACQPGHQPVLDAAVDNESTDASTLRWIHHGAVMEANVLHRAADTKSKYRDYTPLDYAAKQQEHLAQRALDALTARGETLT